MAPEILYTTLQWRHVSGMASEIIENLTVCSSNCSTNSKENITALHYRPFVRGYHWRPVDPHNEPVMRIAFRCHDVIMEIWIFCCWVGRFRTLMAMLTGSQPQANSTTSLLVWLFMVFNGPIKRAMIGHWPFAVQQPPIMHQFGSSSTIIIEICDPFQYKDVVVPVQEIPLWCKAHLLNF